MINLICQNVLREGIRTCESKKINPDFEAPTIEDGNRSGVIGVGGLILAKVPVETANRKKRLF